MRTPYRSIKGAVKKTIVIESDLTKSTYEQLIADWWSGISVANYRLDGEWLRPPLDWFNIQTKLYKDITQIQQTPDVVILEAEVDWPSTSVWWWVHWAIENMLNGSISAWFNSWFSTTSSWAYTEIATNKGSLNKKAMTLWGLNHFRLEYNFKIWLLSLQVIKWEEILYNNSATVPQEVKEQLNASWRVFGIWPSRWWGQTYPSMKRAKLTIIF